jgi:hypothetical protein
MAIPQSTIVTWLGTGIDADLPDVTDFDTNLASNAAARYYAYDTGIDYVLNRNTPAWDAVGGVGGSAAVAGSTGDIQINSSGAFARADARLRNLDIPCYAKQRESACRFDR